MDESELKLKEYLGDGLYAGWDGYHIWLYTLQGMQVALEGGVLQNFKRYLTKNVMGFENG